MVLSERVLPAVPGTGANAGVAVSNFSSSIASRSWAFLRRLKQKKTKKAIAPIPRMIPMARPAFPPDDMPPSTTGTAVALVVVSVDEEVGVDFWPVWDAARMTESVTPADVVGTMEDGRSDTDADGDADSEVAWAALDVLAAGALGLGAELFGAAGATVVAGMIAPTLAVE